MWGRLRYGVTLDFQGRHEEAYRQYELAREVDASDTAKDRVNERLSAGKRDPSVVSLTELEEAVRIVKETGTHEESELAALESRITSPSRGLTSSEIERYFDLLGDLAEARLRRRDPEGCVAAVDRALDLERRAPKESRAKLLALRARALHRIGRTEEALEDLRTARSRASWNWKKRIEHDRRLVGEDPPPGPPRPATPSGGEATTFATRDRGEIRLEIEGSFLPSGERLPLKLVEGTWTASWPVPAGTEIRYRYVADDRYTRPDPLAERTILENDEAWSVRYVGSESAHGVSRDTRNPAPPENPPRSDTRESRPERP